MNYNKLSKDELLIEKDKIEKRLKDIRWNECIDNVKSLPNIIDVNNFENLLYTRILSNRFMLFDISAKMVELEKELTGDIKKGFSLNEIGKAFEFYSSKFNIA